MLQETTVRACQHRLSVTCQSFLRGLLDFSALSGSFDVVLDRELVITDFGFPNPPVQVC